MEAAMLATLIALSLVGHTFNDVVAGSRFDPRPRAVQSLSDFNDTLNGPQTPGRRVGDVIVYESCMRHLCAYYHSVTAIDPRTGAVYAAVYGDRGKVVVAPNPMIERLIGDSCDENYCAFEGDE
jgi:hypothetical protein